MAGFGGWNGNWNNFGYFKIFNLSKQCFSSSDKIIIRKKNKKKFKQFNHNKYLILQKKTKKKHHKHDTN